MSVQRQHYPLRPVLHILVALCTALVLVALLSLLRVGSPARAAGEELTAAGQAQVAASVGSGAAFTDLEGATPNPSPLAEKAMLAVEALVSPAEPLPAWLELAVDPPQAWPGAVVTVTVRLHSVADLAQGTLRAVFPSGLEFAAAQDPAGDVRYVPEERTLQWSLPPVAAGSSELRFQVRIADGAPDLSVLPVELRASAFDGVAVGQAVVKRQFPSTEAIITPDAAGNDLHKTVRTWVTETLSNPTRYFVYTRWISEYVRENGSLPASPSRTRCG